jgi:flagellar biosynthesis protein
MDNKRKMASALKFNPNEDAAPQVVAKGLGLVADNIIEKAKAADVPIYVDAVSTGNWGSDTL